MPIPLWSFCLASIQRKFCNCTKKCYTKKITLYKSVQKYDVYSDVHKDSRLPKISNTFLYSGGLLWIQEWNSLQHSVGASFLATLYSNYLNAIQKTQISCNETRITADDIRKFAMSQVGTASQLWINYIPCTPYTYILLTYQIPTIPVCSYTVIVRIRTLHGTWSANRQYEIGTDWHNTN